MLILPKKLLKGEQSFYEIKIFNSVQKLLLHFEVRNFGRITYNKF